MPAAPHTYTLFTPAECRRDLTR